MAANKGHTGAEYSAAYDRLGSYQAVAKEFGVDGRTVARSVQLFRRDPAVQGSRMDGLDPIIRSRLEEKGYTSASALHSGWVIDKDKNGAGESLYFYLGKGEQSKVDFKKVICDTIQDAMREPPILPPMFIEGTGGLLVLDPADVHIGKLSVKSETGHEYNSDVAVHRLVEGSRSLLAQGLALGVTRVLFVIGNDIAHIDNPKRTTTSGTPQDTDGSIHTIYRAASLGYRRVVNMALEMGLAVDVVFCPSNHDWILGFTIAQELAAWFHDHPNFTATDYNISEAHRKYYRFGNNLMMFTHADGAKEADLPQIMLVEARNHIAECPHRYAYLHHFHHRMKRALGVRPMQREKDHIAMTVSQVGGGAQEGDNLDVLYVRSPSPPDGWHSRNGYLNRQAVEAFIHHPEDGRKITLTEWF